MKNCLKTQLKGVVNNDNLVKLGHILIDVDVAEGVQCAFVVTANESVTCKIIGTGHFYKGSVDNQTDIATELTGTSFTGYRVSPGKYKVDISNKYSLTFFQIVDQKVNLTDLNYSPNCVVKSMIPINITQNELNATAIAIEGRLTVSPKYFIPYGLPASKTTLYKYMDDTTIYPTSYINIGVECNIDVTSLEELTEQYAGSNNPQAKSVRFTGNIFTLNGTLITFMVYITKNGNVYNVIKNVDSSVIATYDPSQPEGSRWTYA